MIYLDTSALVKTILDEPESAALVEYLRARPNAVTSALTRVELSRAVARISPSLAIDPGVPMSTLVFVAVSAPILRSAATVQPFTLRSLDAIHLATILSIREDIEAVVTYDVRLLDAVEALAIPAASPR